MREQGPRFVITGLMKTLVFLGVEICLLLFWKRFMRLKQQHNKTKIYTLFLSNIFFKKHTLSREINKGHGKV